MCRPARTGYAAAGPETAYQASLRGRSSSMS